MPGSGAHDRASHLGTAGEEHVVNRQLEERLGKLDASLEHRDFRLVEILPDDLRAYRAGSRRELVGFCDRGIAGGDHRHQRLEK